MYNYVLNLTDSDVLQLTSVRGQTDLVMIAQDFTSRECQHEFDIRSEFRSANCAITHSLQSLRQTETVI